MSNINDFVIKDGVVTKYVGNGGDVVIPDGVVEIGDWAFCHSKITSIVIPESVTNLGVGTFIRCESLKSITLPNSICEIHDDVFCCCSSLTEIVVPNSVTKLGERVFDDCTSLSVVILPDSLIKIDVQAFRGCTSLADENGFVIVRGVLYDYIGKESIISIPPGVIEISACAFLDNTNLTSVNIPSSVKHIGWRAFLGCASLDSIEIPHIKTIDYEVFEDCCSLRSVLLPEGLRKISHGIFKNCKSLSEIVIPNTITHIESFSLFDGCDSLADIYILAVVKKNGIILKHPVLFSKTSKFTLITKLTNTINKATALRSSKLRRARKDIEKYQILWYNTF